MDPGKGGGGGGVSLEGVGGLQHGGRRVPAALAARARAAAGGQELLQYSHRVAEDAVHLCGTRRRRGARGEGRVAGEWATGRPRHGKNEAWGRLGAQAPTLCPLAHTQMKCDPGVQREWEQGDTGASALVFTAAARHPPASTPCHRQQQRPPACQHTLPPAAAEAAHLPTHPVTGSSGGRPPASAWHSHAPCHHQQQRPPTCQHTPVVPITSSRGHPPASTSSIVGRAAGAYSMQRSPRTCRGAARTAGRASAGRGAARSSRRQASAHSSSQGLQTAGRAAAGMPAGDQPGATADRLPRPTA